MRQSESKVVYQKAIGAITGAGYSVNENAGSGYFDAPFSNEAVNYNLTVFCGDSFLTVVAELPLRVAERKITVALAALNKMSLENPIGNYQISDSQHVQFKFGMIVGEEIDASTIVNNFSFCSNAIKKVVAQTLTWIVVDSNVEA